MEETIAVQEPAPETAPAASAEEKTLKVGVRANTKENAVEMLLGDAVVRITPDMARALANQIWTKAIYVQSFAKEAKKTKRGNR